MVLTKRAESPSRPVASPVRESLTLRSAKFWSKKEGGKSQGKPRQELSEVRAQAI